VFMAWPLVRFAYTRAAQVQTGSLSVLAQPKSNWHDANHINGTESLPMSFVRAYLRASASDQDPERAREDLQRFAKEKGLKVASWYVEQESGAKLDRPELFRLINDAHPGDVLLIEQVDRLSRLNAADWEALKLKLAQKRIRVVALDLPTSWIAATPSADDSTQGLLDAVNRMLLDMLAVVARKDYTDRRRRQAQGIAKAKTAGLYRGRQADLARHTQILDMLDHGISWSQVVNITGASRSTLSRIVHARNAAAA
jgi:DNA invertase Pin-like site-specific DNA recombinase